MAVPLTWVELGKAENAHPWSIRDAAKLLKRAQSKALAGWGFAEQRLPEV